MLKIFLSGDARNPHPGELLPVTDRPMVAFAALVFVRDQLFRFDLTDDLRNDRRAFQRVARFELSAVAEKEHLGERGLLTILTFELFHIEDIALCDAVLFSAGFEYCVGHKVSSEKRSGTVPQPVFSDKGFFGWF